MTTKSVRTAVVTGGLSGIGLATAKVLSADGMRVAIGARRATDKNLCAQVREMIGDNVAILPLDVCNDAAVTSFHKTVCEQLGTPDILVNAAGVTLHQHVCGHDTGEWRTVIETNLTGPFLMTRACLPAMIDGGWGRIVNIASTAARVATADHAAYCASKAGLIGLTRAVALEGAPHGVSCVAVSPTWVETEMLQASAATMASSNGTSIAEEIAKMSEATPQKRLVQPVEIADLVRYLCSDQAGGLTMEDIQVNAGALW